MTNIKAEIRPFSYYQWTTPYLNDYHCVISSVSAPLEIDIADFIKWQLWAKAPHYIIT